MVQCYQLREDTAALLYHNLPSGTESRHICGIWHSAAKCQRRSSVPGLWRERKGFVGKESRVFVGGSSHGNGKSEMD